MRFWFLQFAKPVVLAIAITIGPSGCSWDSSLADNSEQPAALQTWQQVNALFEAGKLNESLETLRSYSPKPDEQGIYFYNFGTILMKMGRLGHAVAYLEKANRLQPHDPSIQHNLQFARTALANAIGRNHLDPASTWFEEIADRVTLEEIRGALGLVGSILVLMWLRFYLRTRRLRKTLFHPAALTASVALLITGGLYSVERLAESQTPAVCLERQIIRSGPGDHYLELSHVEAGVKLRVLGPTSPGVVAHLGASEQPKELWRQVRYSQEGIGWVKDANLLLL